MELVTLLIISVVFNIRTYKINNKSVAFIDGQPVLNKKTLEENLIKKYSENEIVDSINKALVRINYDKMPTEKDLEDIRVKFKGLTEKNNSKERLTEIHYYYGLYINDFKDPEDIESYMSIKDDKNIYKVQGFETTNHNLAVKVENDLKGGLSVEDVEQKYDIKFAKQMFTMLPDALSQEDNEVSVSESEVLHLMDDEGMLIMFIEDVINTNNLKEISSEQINDIYDYIFEKNFHVLKPKINNEMKRKHDINIINN